MLNSTAFRASAALVAATAASLGALLWADGIADWLGEGAPAATAADAQVEPQVARGPKPGWVTPVSAPSPEAADAPIRNGARVLLFDQQQNGAGSEPATFNRSVTQAVSPAGVYAASTYVIPFEPSYERLVLHEAAVIRGGERLDRTGEVLIDFARPETDLNSAMLTGLVNAIIRVPDVRAGDLVDFSLSFEGGHALLDEATFAQIPPSAAGRLRLTARLPEGAGRYAAFGLLAGPERSVADGVETFVFHDGAYAPQPYDPLTPPWRFAYDFAMITSHRDWNEIARWAEPFYAPRDTEAVRALAEELSAGLASEAEKIIAAKRFVQDEIRYFAVTLGDQGYRPLEPDETLRLREGECKAKTLLLISLLEAMGVEAQAALVNLSVGFGVDALPPTPLAFDHVIVTLERDGKRIFIDPTQSGQGGGLSGLSEPDYGFALIVDPQTQALTDMRPGPVEPPAEAWLQVRERFTAGREGGPASISWTYSGPLADIARQALDWGGEEAFIYGFESAYAERFAAQTADPDIAVTDDRAANVIRVETEREATLLDLSAPGAPAPVHVIAAHAAYPYIVLSGPQRDQPLIVPYPYSVDHEVRVALPPELAPSAPPAPERIRYKNAAFVGEALIAYGGDELVLRHRIDSLGREIEGAEVLEAWSDQQAAAEYTFTVIGDERYASGDMQLLGRAMEPSVRPRLGGGG